MLQVASFKMSEGEKINELLSKYRLAAGAHIMVSNGEVLIPYEDGREDTKEVKIVSIQEMKNELKRQKDLIIHSQGVMKAMVADAKARANKAKMDFDSNQSNKKLEQKHKEAEQAVDQAELQVIKNDEEIIRIDLNCAKFDEIIASFN